MDQRTWIEGIAGMGLVDQVASASLAALFSIGMLIASHVFMEYRSARGPSVGVVQPIRLLSDNVRLSTSRGFDGAL
jgi:hypothetical protein